jgi:hypothetical protein
LVNNQELFKIANDIEVAGNGSQKENGKPLDKNEKNGHDDNILRLNFNNFKLLKRKLFPKQLFSPNFIETTFKDRMKLQEKVAPFALVS